MTAVSPTLPNWLTERVVRLGRSWLRRPVEPPPLVIASDIGVGHVDSARVHGDRVLSVVGWARDLDAFRSAVSVQVGGERLRVAHAFRVFRPDVPGPAADASGFMGAIVEWVLPEAGGEAIIEAHGRRLAALPVPPGPAPAYPTLRDGAAIWHRDQIYGSGPPVHEVLHESLALALTLPEPVLDFGCGGGALVRALRAHGREAYGLELDHPRIHQHLLPEVRPFVILYDGTGPAPFPRGHFAAVACCEVLEHLPDPASAVDELARLARQAILVTVPDLSAVPRGFRHGVVPWHLLESTHVNFFTQQALEALLAPYARRLDIARVGEVRCGPLSFHTSIAARVTLASA